MRKRHADDDEYGEVFTVRFTGEEFNDYEQYADTCFKYRLPIWSCPVTGKGGLTYEQALISQRAAQGKADFPTAWLEPLLCMVQHSQRQLNDLVDFVYDRFKSEFIVDEEVYPAGDGDASSGTAGRVRRVLGSWYKDPSQSASSSTASPAKGSGSSSTPSKRVQYEVDFGGQKKTLPSSQLRKLKAPFSKQMLKQKIREVAYKETYPQAPWIVRQKVIAEFPAVPTTMPKNIQKIVDDARKKKQKTEPESGPSEAKPVAKEAPPVKKYPMEDLELVKECRHDSPFLNLPKPIPLPSYAGDLIYLCDLVDRYGRALKLSPFTYDQLLMALEPANARDDPMLLNELHVQLFKHIKEEFHTSTTEEESGSEAEEREVRKTRGKRKGRDNEGEVTHNSWRRQVREYLREAQKDGDLQQNMVIWLEDTVIAYNQLKVVDKLRILKFLGDEALDTSLLRDEIDTIILNADVLRKERWQLDADFRDKKKKFEESKRQDALAKDAAAAAGPSKPNGNAAAKQREAARKEEAAKKKLQQEESKMNQESESHRRKMENLKRELSKLSIRHKCLGQDRNYSSYWTFRWDPRVFVEAQTESGWSCYVTLEETEQLMAALNPKGLRESKLLEAITKEKTAISSRIRGEHKAAVLQELGRRTTRVTARKSSDDEDAVEAKGGYVNRYKQAASSNHR